MAFWLESTVIRTYGISPLLWKVMVGFHSGRKVWLAFCTFPDVTGTGSRDVCQEVGRGYNSQGLLPSDLLHPARLYLLKLLQPLKRVTPTENCVQTHGAPGNFVFKLYQISSPMSASIRRTGTVLGPELSMLNYSCYFYILHFNSMSTVRADFISKRRMF